MEQYDDITMLALRYSDPEYGYSAAEESKHELIELIDDETRLVMNTDIGKMEEFAVIIRDKLIKAGCPEKIRDQIELSAEEIFVNISRHANVDSCEIAIKISGKKEMTISFSDNGLPFNPLDYPAPDINSLLTRKKRGGLGIVIVKRVMDMIEYNYNEGKNHLLMKKSW